MIKQARVIPLLPAIFFTAFTIGCNSPHSTGCRRYCFGSYNVAGSDSVYVFRSLKYWLEYDVKHSCKTIFSVRWKDPCNFTLFYIGNRSMDSSYQPYKPDDTVNYSATANTAGGITFHVQTHSTSSVRTLLPYNDTAVWKRMLQQDTSMENPVHDTQRVSAIYANRFSKAFEEQINSATDTGELNRIDDLMTLLGNGNIDSAFSFGSQKLQKHSPRIALYAYNQFVQTFYGRLQWYGCSLLPESPGNSPNPQFRSFILNAGFEKVKRGVKIAVTFTPDSLHHLITFSVVADSASQVTEIKNFTMPLMELIKKEKYREFYDALGDTAKHKMTFATVAETLKAIHDKGHLDDFRIYFFTFRLRDKQGGFIASYQRKTADERTTLDFTFMIENDKFVPEGIEVGH